MSVKTRDTLFWVVAAFILFLWKGCPHYRKVMAARQPWSSQAARPSHKPQNAPRTRTAYVATEPADEVEPDDGAPLPGIPTFSAREPLSPEAFDPFRHPEQVYDLIAEASGKYNRDGELPELGAMLQSIWRTESGGSLGGQLVSKRRFDIDTDAEYADDERPNCNAFREYDVRNQWRGASGTRERIALTAIAEAHGYEATKLYGSCGRSSLLTDRKNFGGCIAAMQITPSEWVRDEEYGDKDPYDLYWIMHAVAKRLRGHYDEGRAQGLDHRAAVLKALSRYYGADPELKYRTKTLRVWREAYEWDQRGVLREEIAEIARRNISRYIPPAPVSRAASN